MTVRVASASETVACERATMAKGITSAELMSRAGQAAAREIQQRCSDYLSDGVIVYPGPGNNGGDGWVVAESLVKSGIAVHVVNTAPPRSEEATKAREMALGAGLMLGEDKGGQRLIVDALLGTGSSGAPRGDIARSIDEINVRRDDGAFVVAGRPAER